MKRILSIACVLVAATGVGRAEPFAAALHHQLRVNGGNLIYSPASVRIALAMAMAGARGATQMELAKALQLAATPETASTIGSLVRLWDSFDPKEIVLRARDRVWVQREHQLVERYVKALRDDFHSEIGVVDFARDADGARDAINAIYFKGKWAAPFYATETRDEPFFVDGTEQAVRRTMHQYVYERAAQVDGALVLEKEYGASGSRIVMDIILPNERDGLAKIEDAYVKGALPGWLKKLGLYRVDVALPKFAMATTMDVTWALRGLGVTRATSPSDADFSGIDGGRNLYVDEILQKAVVEVDETGARAAAATYGGTVPMLALNPPPEPPKIDFHADHPFLFVIRDVSAGWVLFAGRVSDPRS